jgi:hypothetical protein
MESQLLWIYIEGHRWQFLWIRLLAFGHFMSCLVFVMTTNLGS